MSKNETNLCITRFLDWFGMLSVQIWQKSLCSNAPLQKPTFFDLCLVARPPSSQTQCIISYTSKSLFQGFFNQVFSFFIFRRNKWLPLSFTTAARWVGDTSWKHPYKNGCISIFIANPRRSCFPKSNKKIGSWSVILESGLCNSRCFFSTSIVIFRIIIWKWCRLIWIHNWVWFSPTVKYEK